MTITIAPPLWPRLLLLGAWWANVAAAAWALPGAWILWVELGVAGAVGVAWHARSPVATDSDAILIRWLYGWVIGIVGWSAMAMAFLPEPMPVFMPLCLLSPGLSWLWMPPSRIAWKGAVWACAMPAIVAPFWTLAIETKAPSAEAVLSTVVFVNVVVALAVGFAVGPAFRNPRFVRFTTVSRRGLACALPVAFLAFVFSALWQDIARNVALPSVGDLPPIGTAATPVFRAVFRGTPQTTDPYWRSVRTYPWPVGTSEWAATSAPAFPFPADVEGPRLLRPLAQTVRYTYDFESAADGDSALFEMDGTVSREPVAMADGVVRTRHTALAEFVDGPLDGLSPTQRVLYLSIPSDPTRRPGHVDQSGAAQMPRARALAERWRAEENGDAEAIAQRALGYFHENLAYHFDHQSLDPARNQVDHFLFVERKGVCRHFANAFALLMRLADVPSRVVGGYQGGQFDAATATWTVRQRDAHAWTEIWIPEWGWTRVDPTSVVPVEKAVPKADAVGWGRWAGYAKVRWGESMATAGQAWSNTPPSDQTPASGPAPLRTRPSSLWGVGQPSRGWAVAVVFVGILVLAWAVWRAWHRRCARDPIDRAWDGVRESAKRSGHGWDPAEGPATMGRRLGASISNPAHRAQWKAAVARYERWRFGGVSDPGLAHVLRQAAHHIKPVVRKPADRQSDGLKNE